MPQTIEANNTDLQTVQRPDGKYQYFKKSWSQDRIDKYFEKQGWIKKTDGWYTKNGEKLSDLNKVPSKIPAGETGASTSGRIGLKSGQDIKLAGKFGTTSGASYPTVLGMAGGTIAGTPGAAFGGALGEGLKQLQQRILYNNEIGNKQAALDMLKEAGIQAAVQKGGDLAGAGLFHILNKIPHSKLMEGIPFLPSEYKEHGVVMKYVEDLLSNLAPSAKTMEDFKTGQTNIITKKLETMVNGFAKFKGTSEDMGELLQNAVRVSDKEAWDNLVKIAKSRGIKDKAVFAKMPELKEWQEIFKNSLMKAIETTESPSLIGGFLRNKNLASVENARHLVGVLEEKNPALLGKVQNRLLRDMIAEAMQGSKDPAAKGVVKGVFKCKEFKNVVDKMEEERLKVIFGQDGYDSLENFIALTHNVGAGTGASAGRFWNIAFLFPFRNGVNLRSGAKLGMTALAVNRLAKVVTSPEGMKLYEAYIRGIAMGATRAANLAREEIEAFNKRSDQEYEIERKQAEESYKKEKQAAGVQ